MIYSISTSTTIIFLASKNPLPASIPLIEVVISALLLTLGLPSTCITQDLHGVVCVGQLPRFVVDLALDVLEPLHGRPSLTS